MAKLPLPLTRLAYIPVGSDIIGSISSATTPTIMLRQAFIHLIGAAISTPWWRAVNDMRPITLR